MRKIILYPDARLRQVAPIVTKVDKELLKDVEDIKVMLRESENGAGLAAPQIGVNKRFFGMKDYKTREVEVFINPRITGSWGVKDYPKLVGEDGREENFLEGCLSFPDFFGTVKRYLKIAVEWEELMENRLETRSQKLEGFEAIVWQHESDHLEGILFVDYVKREGGKFYKWAKRDKVEWNIDKVIEKNK